MNFATILFLASALPGAAFAQGSCPLNPVIRAGLFNTNGLFDAPAVSERIAAMATALPQAAQNLDVLCLNDLRDGTQRTAALANFDRNVWNIYHPDRRVQTGCSNACATNRTVTAYNLTLPYNKWAEYCSLSPVPGTGATCSELSTEAEYNACIANLCPFLPQRLIENSTCGYCLNGAVPAESRTSRIFKCSATFTDTDAFNCRYGHNGEAGGTLLSRFPFVATEYREFTGHWELPSLSASDHYSSSSYYNSHHEEPGLANWGITYGQIQTSMGRVHLFCSSQATSASGMFPASAERLNTNQSQEVLNYIQSKTNGEPAIFLGGTGNGPAVASSPTGSALAQWPASFSILQTGLADTLLANTGGSAAACTYGCAGAAPSYEDHIMTSGTGTSAQSNPLTLCYRNGGALFTANTVNTTNGPVPLSPHFGVRTDISAGRTAVITWNAPAPILFGSALGSAQLNATANLPGTLTYNPPAGTVLPIGANQPLQVTFTPTDTVNYVSATASTTITVTAANTGGRPNLIVQRTLSRDANRNIVVNLVIANNGGSTATNVTVTALRLGAANGTPLPLNLGSVAAGTTASAVFTIPGSASLATGSASSLTVGGGYTGGTFNSSTRVTLP